MEFKECIKACGLEVTSSNGFKVLGLEAQGFVVGFRFRGEKLALRFPI